MITARTMIEVVLHNITHRDGTFRVSQDDIATLHKAVELLEAEEQDQEQRRDAAARDNGSGIYWCCRGDFGKHEPTCANYKGGE
jgi:hypothetical protein